MFASVFLLVLSLTAWLFLIIGALALAICVLVFYILVGQKKQETNYKATNQWMRQMLRAMPDMAVVFDKDLVIVDIINPQRNVLLTMSVEKLKGIAVRQLGNVDPDFRSAAQVMADNIEETVISRKANVFEYEVKKEGVIYYAVCRSAPFLNNQVICFIHDDTEYVASEKKTGELKSFFQSIIDNLPIGLLVKNIDDDLRYVFFNDYLLDFFGNENPFKIGQNDYDRWEPMTEEFVKEDRMVIESGKPVSFERMSFDERTGMPTRWSITTKSCFTGPDGTPYLIAATVETTESKRKDFELIKTQEELTLALEAGKVAAWFFDPRTQMYSSLNGRTISQDGMTREEINKLIHPADREKINAGIETLISGKEDKIKMVIRFVVEGRIDWFETYVIGVRNNKGEVYQVIGTERKITEEIEKQRELENANYKLELAFNSAQIIPWEMDIKTKRYSTIKEGVLESSNPTLKEYVNFIHEEDRLEFLKKMESVLNGKKETVVSQVRMNLPGQEQCWYEIHATVADRDEKGRISHIIGVRRDINALKMTDELIELRDKAEHSNRLKSAFLANMSHEIRTPLNAIVGFSQLIMQTDNLEEKENYYQIIESNNDLLLQLISDILDLSKIEADEMDFFFTEFPINEMFHYLDQVYSFRVQKGVTMVLDLPEIPCSIVSERNRLTQVLSNFVSNAVKFTSSGSITIGYSYIDNGLRFYVRDTGKGIEPENLPNVFARFSKFDTFVQGNGLGLSICQHIVTYLKGEIGVESELGKGAEFWFTIPCEPVMIKE